MYCHQCGAKIHGEYCSNCGAKRIIPDDDHETIPHDWSDEIRYEVLLQRPEVREFISRYASQSPKRMSGEAFLDLCDKAFQPLTGVSIARIGEIVQPVYSALGIKTGTMRKEFMNKPAGKVLVAAICSMARHGQPLNKVEQGQDGCLLKAGIPSDMWSFAGDLVFTVKREEQGTYVEAATVIKGQLFDWGKSKSILNELFDDLEGLPV